MAEKIAVHSEVVDFVFDDAQKFHNFYRQGTANVLKYLANDLTVPFIARYRKKGTGGMDAEKIRQIHLMYENYKKIQNKVSLVLKKIGSEVSNDLVESLKKAKSVEEVQELYAPFKKGGKGTLAERARKLGLDVIALAILKTPSIDIHFNSKINQNIEGLNTEKDVMNGVQHILADLIAKDAKIQEEMKVKIEAIVCIDPLLKMLNVKEVSSDHTIQNPKSGRKFVTISTKVKSNAKELDKNEKFTIYYQFRSSCDYMKSYQILAINRAESHKIISVKLEIDQHARDKFLHYIKDVWVPTNATNKNQQLMSDSVEDAFHRLIEKSYLRRLRSRMSKEAELDAIEIFSRNLQQLLLVAPVKNENVLSIDPGFKSGCKIAVINKNGSLLETCIIYPFNNDKRKNVAKEKLIRLVKKHSACLIAIGNGTACRETECLISEMIKNKNFKPMHIQYSIVNESGASIYSVTKEAKDEFGDLDPNLISAVSIGRRLQDPLLELVKIEAKHIGVGMYQHDVDETLLKAATTGVVEDCVSFVGVDLNACSVSILKRLAGVTQKQAEAIIEYRESAGDFVNRKELERIKGIGKVTFRNIAGFIRIVPKRYTQQHNENKDLKVEDITHQRNSKKRKLISEGNKPAKKRKTITEKTEFTPEIFDQTCIHPESYELAYRVLDFLEIGCDMIGTDEMKQKIRDSLHTNHYPALVECFHTDEESLRLIFDGLQQSINHDFRADFEKPAFKTGLTSIHQLKLEQLVSGVVRNTTSFGIFVDIGIICDGLMHSRNISRGITLGPGDRVECKVTNIDAKRERVGLKYMEKLSNDIVLK